MSSDIFISYAWEDRSIAEAMAQFLEYEGWSVWWDRDQLPGKDIDLEIEQGIAEAKVVLVMWSKYSVRSDNVRDEAQKGRHQNKLLPLKLEEIDVPLFCSRLSTIDLIGWPDQDLLFELATLKTAIKKFLTGGAPKQHLQKPRLVNETSLSIRSAARTATEIKNVLEQAGFDISNKVKFEEMLLETVFKLLAIQDKEERIIVLIRELSSWQEGLSCSIWKSNQHLATAPANQAGVHLSSQTSEKLLEISANTFADLHDSGWPCLKAEDLHWCARAQGENNKDFCVLLLGKKDHGLYEPSRRIIRISKLIDLVEQNL